jgi:hypothetical protein
MFDVEIPDWVAWLAQDKDGSWWGYSVEPHQHSTGWYENEVGEYIRLGGGEPNPDWQNSLRRNPG